MNPNEKLEYFVYCRKSSEENDRQILSLRSQEDEMKRISEHLNLRVKKIFRESKSAKAPGREIFNDMLNRLERGEANGVLCWKIDRLARNPVDEGRVKWLLQSSIIKNIKTPDRDYYPEDNVLITAVEFGVANQYIKDLSANTKRGLRTKIEMGQPPYYAPTGYVNDPITHNWKPDQIRAPFIKQMFEWYDEGSDSTLQIVKKLGMAGFTTRYGKPIGKSMVGRILRSPVYYGYFIAHGELKKGVYEPLISRELWQRVQDRLDGRVTYKDRTTKLVFKYRGFLFCGECGCSITAERQKGHVYYRCTKARGFCSQGYVREEDLEVQLFDIFERIHLSNSDIKSIQGSLLDLYEKDREFQTQTVKNLRTELTKLEEDKKKIYRRLVLGEVDIDREIVFELKNDVEARIKAIQDQISSLADNSYDWLEQSSNLLKLANQAKELFLAATPEQKRELLDFVSSNRVLTGKKLGYELNKPFALATEIKAHNAERPDNLSGRPIWLRGQDSNLQPIDYTYPKVSLRGGLYHHPP